MDVTCAQSLIRQLSDLAAHDIEPLGAGTDSAAFRVDAAWVVRFPLVPAARSALRTELALLPELANELPVAVPVPERIGQRDGRIVFSVYRALKGEPLSDAALGALSPAARTRALDKLASVLDSIHRFPQDRARAAGVAFEICKGAHHAAQDDLVRELGGKLGAVERAAITRQRHAFQRAQPSSLAPAVLHADIKPAHLLHEPSSGALTGLIDWGDLSLGHADFDLAIIGAFCGERTLQGLLERLDTNDAERARASIPFLLTIRWLQDTLHALKRHGNTEQVHRALHRLRAHLTTSVA